MHELSRLLQFGMQSDVLRHISEVQSGLACNCHCPACNEPLVAKKGNVKVHHFAHSSGTECAAAFETALHFAAKQLLAKRLQICLPAVMARFNGSKGDVVVRAPQLYGIDEVRIEKRFGTIVPDVLVVIDGKTIAVEILVTHAVDELKTAKIQELLLSTVEVDLSCMPRNVEWDVLEKFVIDSPNLKSWIFNIEAIEYRKNALANTTCFPIVQPGKVLQVNNCPIWKRQSSNRIYANIEQDCRNCSSSVEFELEQRRMWCNAIQTVFQDELFERDA